MSEREHVLSESGPAAPPRSNGELLFAEPWESRAFGITLALYEAGRFAWSEFQSRLIQAIAGHEAELEAAVGSAAEGEGSGYRYYECWLEALRMLAADKGWLEPLALASLEAQLAARPPGHDH